MPDQFDRLGTRKGISYSDYRDDTLLCDRPVHCQQSLEPLHQANPDYTDLTGWPYSRRADF